MNNQNNPVDWINFLWNVVQTITFIGLQLE